MKKLALMVMVLLVFAQALRAQDLSTPQRVLDLSGGYQPFTLTSAVTSQLFNTTGMDSHSVTYTFPANVTGVTVTVSGSTDGGLTYATIGTSTAGAGTISFSGTYFTVKVSESGMTAAMPAMAGVYNGSLMAGHGVMICGLSSVTCVPIAVDSNGNVKTTPGSGASSTVVVGQGAPGAGTGIPVSIQGISGGSAVFASIPIACPPGYAHVQGAVVTTSAASAVLIAAPSAGKNLYILSIQNGNSGATNSSLSFYTNGDATAMATWVNPTNTTPFGGAMAPIQGVLLTTSTGKSFDVVTGSGSTTQYINAQGCSGP